METSASCSSTVKRYPTRWHAFLLDNRGNLVMGAIGEARGLTERDEWICSEVGPVLRERGVIFAGIDVIGDYLTEINVTSPTGIRELDSAFDLNIAGTLFDAIESKLG